MLIWDTQMGRARCVPGVGEADGDKVLGPLHMPLEWQVLNLHPRHVALLPISHRWFSEKQRTQKSVFPNVRAHPREA